MIKVVKISEKLVGIQSTPQMATMSYFSATFRVSTAENMVILESDKTISFSGKYDDFSVDAANDGGFVTPASAAAAAEALSEFVGNFKSGGSGGGGSVSPIEIVDNLNSTDVDKALSARMGKELNEIKINDAPPEIVQTNITSMMYNTAFRASDGTLYFCNSSSVGGAVGIKKLLPGADTVVDTNITTGLYSLIFQAADGTIYFGSSDSRGIKKLLPGTDTIVNTNITTGSFSSAFQAANGAIYFFNSPGSTGVEPGGIKKLLPGTDTIIDTNITTGYYRYAVQSSDGTIYFCGSVGIQKLLPGATNIVDTNITAGNYYFAFRASDGTIYFCGSSGTRGIKKLLPGAGTIVNTNITDGYYPSAFQAADGTIYFLNAGSGIKKKLPGTDTIIDTNIMTGRYLPVIQTADGTIYFCSDGNEGIKKKLPGTDTIIDTNIMTGRYLCAIQADSGTIYFCSNSGGGYIKKLPVGQMDIVDTNITTGVYLRVIQSADGVIYFYGNPNGILRTVPHSYLRKRGEWVEYKPDGGVEISAADKVLKIEPDGLLAQLSLKKIGSSNSMSLTGLNSTTLLVASRAALEGVTSMKFSGRITGNASYAANPGYIRIAFQQAGSSVSSEFYNLHQLTAVGDFDQTFNSVDIILALRAALDNHPDWEAFEIIIVVDGYGFAGAISTVLSGALAIDAEEKILLTGRDGETLASVKLEPLAAGVVSMPNYSAMETINRIIANNGEWTVDRNGFVVASIQVIGTYSAICTINGKGVGQSYSGTGAGSQAFLRDVYQVKAGDVVKLFTDAGTPTNISCYYIPPVYVQTDLSGLINYPNQWPANTEIDLGNGLYGKRITGTITAAVDERAAVSIQTGVSNVISYGGTWGAREIGGGMPPVGGLLTQGSGTTPQGFLSEIRLDSSGYMGFYSTSNAVRSGGANTRYDVWVKYTK